MDTPVVKPETIEFIFDQTKGAVDKQLADLDAMDAKASSIFTISSAIIGLAGIFTVFRSSVTTTVTTAPGTTVTTDGEISFAVTALLLAAVVAYLIGAVAAVAGWWLRNVQRGDFAMTLWYEHWQHDVIDIKHMIVAAIPEIVRYNSRAIRIKALALTVALVSTVVEVILVGIALGLLTT